MPKYTQTVPPYVARSLSELRDALRCKAFKVIYEDLLVSNIQNQQGVYTMRFNVTKDGVTLNDKPLSLRKVIEMAKKGTK